jgi:hypothetical protein
MVALMASTHSWDVFSALFGTVNLNVLESTITLKVVAFTYHGERERERERERGREGGR